MRKFVLFVMLGIVIAVGGCDRVQNVVQPEVVVPETEITIEVKARDGDGEPVSIRAFDNAHEETAWFIRKTSIITWDDTGPPEFNAYVEGVNAYVEGEWVPMSDLVEVVIFSSTDAEGNESRKTWNRKDYFLGLSLDNAIYPRE